MWSWRMRNQQLEGHEGFLDREESMWEDAQMDMEAAGYVCEQWTTGRSFLRWLKWKICLKWRHWGGSLFSLSDLSFVLRVSRHPCNVLVELVIRAERGLDWEREKEPITGERWVCKTGGGATSYQWKRRNESGVYAELCWNIHLLVIEEKKPRTVRTLAIEPKRVKARDVESEVTWEHMAFAGKRMAGRSGQASCRQTAVIRGYFTLKMLCGTRGFHFFRSGARGTLGPVLGNLWIIKNFM